MKNITGCFKTTGIFLLNHEAILSKASQPEQLDTFDKPSLPKETVIKFLPLSFARGGRKGI